MFVAVFTTVFSSSATKAAITELWFAGRNTNASICTVTIRNKTTTGSVIMYREMAATTGTLQDGQVGLRLEDHGDVGQVEAAVLVGGQHRHLHMRVAQAAVGDAAQAYALGSGNWQILRYTKRDGTALVELARTIRDGRYLSGRPIEPPPHLFIGGAETSDPSRVERALAKADAGALPAGTSSVYPTTGADDTKGVKVHATDKVTGKVIEKTIDVVTPSSPTPAE